MSNVIFNKAYHHFKRRLVCKRCHAVMSDLESCSSEGEFYHSTLWANDKKGNKLPTPKKNPCPNAGRTFTMVDLGPGRKDKSLEVEVFARKKARRSDKRQGFVRVDGHD